MMGSGRKQHSIKPSQLLLNYVDSLYSERVSISYNIKTYLIN